MQSTSRAIAPTLTLVEGVPTTTSVEVAKHFGKAHDDVLRRIRVLIEQLDGNQGRNFAEMVNEVQIGGGAIRKDPAFRLTRTGFTLLAMGFTGKKALAFKLAYIDEFDRMERELLARQVPHQQALPAIDCITPAEQQTLVELVHRQAASVPAPMRGKAMAEAWSRLHNKFRVAKYSQLQRSQLTEAISYITGLHLKNAMEAPNQNSENDRDAHTDRFSRTLAVWKKKHRSELIAKGMTGKLIAEDLMEIGARLTVTDCIDIAATASAMAVAKLNSQ